MLIAYSRITWRTLKLLTPCDPTLHQMNQNLWPKDPGNWCFWKASQVVLVCNRVKNSGLFHFQWAKGFSGGHLGVVLEFLSWRSSSLRHCVGKHWHLGRAAVTTWVRSAWHWETDPQHLSREQQGVIETISNLWAQVTSKEEIVPQSLTLYCYEVSVPGWPDLVIHQEKLDTRLLK